MHLSDGDIRAYHDLAPGEDSRAEVKAHLDSCAACRQREEALLARAHRVGERLSALSASSLHQPQTVREARLRLEERLSPQDKEYTTMLSKFFSRSGARLSRPAWAALAVVALLAVALAFPSVRAAANSFLGLFRVQQFSIVQVNPGNLPEQLGSSSQFEAMMSQDVQFDKQGEVQKVASAQEAGDMAGFAVRLPKDISGEQKLAVQPGGGITLKVDLQHVQALLDEIGRSDIQLPAALDGATVSVDVPKGVIAMYGSCKFDAEAARQTSQVPDNPQEFLGRNCTTLIQMPSPSVEAPPGLDMKKIGEAYLQVMGLTPEEAAHFAQNVDWTSTFVIPIPRNGTTYREVQVDGVTATLIELRQEGHPRQYMLLWVKDGIVYALSGPGQIDDALTIANSLQ